MKTAHFTATCYQQTMSHDEMITLAIDKIRNQKRDESDKANLMAIRE
jgi:hypothetical protein